MSAGNITLEFKHATTTAITPRWNGENEFEIYSDGNFKCSFQKRLLIKSGIQVKIPSGYRLRWKYQILGYHGSEFPITNWPIDTESQWHDLDCIIYHTERSPLVIESSDPLASIHLERIPRYIDLRDVSDPTITETRKRKELEAEENFFSDDDSETSKKQKVKDPVSELVFDEDACLQDISNNTYLHHPIYKTREFPFFYLKRGAPNLFAPRDKPKDLEHVHWHFTGDEKQIKGTEAIKDIVFKYPFKMDNFFGQGHWPDLHMKQVKLALEACRNIWNEMIATGINPHKETSLML